MNKTEIYIILGILLLLTVCAIAVVPHAEKKFIVNKTYVADGYACTSVNTVVFRKNALCTKDSTEYVAYYDNEGVLTLGRRLLNDTVWELQQSQYRGEVEDAHRSISIAVDDSGYLHVAFNHHDSPLMYTRSVKPQSLVLDTLLYMTGSKEERVSYPEFHKLQGKLMFAYRDGASGNGNLILNIYDTENKRWTRLVDNLIDGQGERSAYWQIYTSERGTIHISWVWRESWLVETNHDMCYACSHDQGKTWQRSDGTYYELPINVHNAEVAWQIPQNSELINQTSMTADENDRPCIATYWREQGDSVPQYRVIMRTDAGWQMKQVSRRKQPFSLSGGGTKMIPIARPQIVARGEKAMMFVRDREDGGRVAMYVTDNLHRKNTRWKREFLTDSDVNAWEPNIDYDLWQEEGRIALFVQNTMQGDGEKTVETDPQPIYVIEIESDDF